MLVTTNYRVKTRTSGENRQHGDPTAALPDRDAVIVLWTAAGLTRPWNDPVLDFERALGGPSSTILVGEADGALVATAMVGHDGHRGWVYYVAVREDARRQRPRGRDHACCRGLAPGTRDPEGPAHGPRHNAAAGGLLRGTRLRARLGAGARPAPLTRRLTQRPRIGP